MIRPQQIATWRREIAANHDAVKTELGDAANALIIAAKGVAIGFHYQRTSTWIPEKQALKVRQ